MMTYNEIKEQVSERLMVSMKIEGTMNVIISLSNNEFYVAAVVKSIERNQLEVVGFSTPNANPEEVKYVKEAFSELLVNEVYDMIKSVSPNKVSVVPYEGFKHREYLMDWVSFNVNEDIDVYFINDNTEVA